MIIVLIKGKTIMIATQFLKHEGMPTPFRSHNTEVQIHLQVKSALLQGEVFIRKCYMRKHKM